MAAVLVIGAACATLQPVQEPAQFIPEAKPQVVFVTFLNHSKVEIAQPRVRGDTLFGMVRGAVHPMAAPLSHIERIEAVQRDKSRTRWLIAGLGALTVAGVFALAQSGSGEEGCDTTYYRSPCIYEPGLGPL